MGEVRGKVLLRGISSRIVTVNGSDCELKEVMIADGTGQISVTLWDSFVSQAEGGLSYSFKELSTRERDGSIRLCTAPASSIEQIDDLDVPEGGCDGGDEDGCRALFSATVKGIEVTIKRKCVSCQFKQREFVEKSATHRCEGCRLKQASVAFSASFGGKAAVSTAVGEERVLLTSSALTTYLRAAGLSSLFNDAEAVEDHFLQSAVFDMKVNTDGFLVSIEPADATRASQQLTGDAEGGAAPLTEGADSQLSDQVVLSLAEGVEAELAEGGGAASQS
ncbi:MAG: hypothetical protein ACRC2N_01290 [Aeromonas sp.]